MVERMRRREKSRLQYSECSVFGLFIKEQGDKNKGREEQGTEANDA